MKSRKLKLTCSNRIRVTNNLIWSQMNNVLSMSSLVYYFEVKILPQLYILNDREFFFPCDFVTMRPENTLTFDVFYMLGISVLISDIFSPSLTKLSLICCLKPTCYSQHAFAKSWFILNLTRNLLEVGRTWNQFGSGMGIMKLLLKVSISLSLLRSYNMSISTYNTI